MASVARFMMARGLNGTDVAPLYQSASTNTTGGNDAATLRLINSLVFAESKSVRTSTIILAVFNVLASATTAGSILYDCYWASKRCNPKFKASKFCVSSIHPAETFPLILAIGIVIQGIVFAGVQAQGLSALFTKGCSEIAQFMWPAIMIVPYIQLVFGLECTFRSLRRIPFQARGKYDVTICCATIVLMLIATWIPSHIFPEPNICFASLVWFISRYGKPGLIILSTVGGVLLISAVTIFTRLSTVTMIDQHQRIAASRMVYYLVLGIVSLAFVIPYFVSQTIAHGDIKAGMMATVVLNLSGLMSGLLHLFLRSNTATTAFGPKNGRHWSRDKHQIRIWGPNELAFGTHLIDPVAGPGTSARELESRADSRVSLVGPEKGRAISMESLSSPPFHSPRFNPLASNPNAVEQKAIMPTFPEPTAETSAATRGHVRKQSYSLFPTEMTSPTKGPQQNARPAESVYDISDLAPPPAIFGPGASRHRRDSSIASSATVQIGLRLSHAPTPSMEDASIMPLPQTTYDALPSTTFNANATALKPTTSIPLSTFNANTPSPLKVQTQITKPEPPVRSPRRPSPLITNVTSAAQLSPVLASINKLLPPTPKTLASVVRESNTQLSPAVYSPEKKLPGPSKAVTTPQSATTPLRNNLLGDGSPTRVVRSNSNRAPATTQSKSDWI